MRRSKLGSTWPMATEILNNFTWGVIEEAVVLAPSKLGHFVLGWHGAKSITKSSYDVVAQFSGDNMNAMDLMEVNGNALAIPLRHTVSTTALSTVILISSQSSL